MRVLVVLALLFIGAMPPAARTSAYFTSALASSGLSFASARIELGADLANTTAIVVTGLYPSDTTSTGTFKLFEVSNSGDADLYYHVAVDTSNNDTKKLANELLLRVARVGAASDCAGGLNEAGVTANLYGATTGLAPAPTSTAVDNPDPVNLVGIRGASTHSGASTAAQLLTPGVTDRLCFRFWLPQNAKDSVQGGGTTAEIRFVATQKAGLDAVSP